MASTILMIFVLDLMCLGSFALPLPRIVSTSAARRSVYWELDPVPIATDYTVLHDFAKLSVYGYPWTALDPERSYIEIEVPDEYSDTAKTEKKPSSKPKPAPTLIINPIQNITSNIANCTNSTIAMNCTDGFNNTTNATATLSLVMTNHEQPLYSHVSQWRLNNTEVSGAYELAFVTCRPKSSIELLLKNNYPYIKYANYTLLPWRIWSEPPLIQECDELHQAVYVYKPVYPRINQKYDVYQYFMVTKEVMEDTEGSKITMPDTRDVQSLTNTATSTNYFTSTLKNLEMTKEKTEQENYVDNSTANTQKSVQLDIRHPHIKQKLELGGIDHDNTEQIQNFFSSGNKKVGQDVNVQNAGNETDLEKGLERVSDQELFQAVESVLEALEERLSD